MAAKADRWSALQVELARHIEDIALEEGWPRGKRIRAAGISRRLGVSRSPVNGALDFLEKTGVVRREPRRGFVLLDPAAANGRRTATARDEDLMTTIMRARAFGQLEMDVSEAELTERYRVSRGEVRKALQRLASNGLVIRSRGHGWHFEEALDTDEAVDESYEFRILVECAGLRSPRFRADPQTLRQLFHVHRPMVDKGAGLISPEAWFKLNAGFHEALAAWSGNRFLLQAVRQQNALRRLHEYAEFGRLSIDRIIQSSTEHVAILEAINEGDIELAESLLRKHLLLAKKSS